MIQLFDNFNRYEIPSMTLCQPNKEELYALGDLFDRQLKLRFNGLSEFSFSAKSKIKTSISGVEVIIDTPYFELLDYRRLVYIQNIGYFMITQIDNATDGFSNIKKILAQSLEVEFNFKKVSLFKGDFFLWSLENPERTLLGKLLQYNPNTRQFLDWKLAHIDTELTTNTRSFDETDTTIYSLLMNKVSQSYNCIFHFDTINKEITVKTVANSTTPTDIYLSYDNLLENTNIKPITEELVTSLTVLGADPLSINVVNPLGTNNIYNFHYYKDPNWMSGSLITAVDSWEHNIINNQQSYADILASLKNANTLLTTQNSQLATLEGELAALEEIRTVRIRQGLKLVPPDSTITEDINAKNDQIKAKKNEIAATKYSISNKDTNGVYGFQQKLEAINRAVSFENNFTSAEYAELSTFIIGSTYTNTNFVQYDSMSGSSIQDQAQQLYDQGVQVLAKVSEPRYTFEVGAVNFVFLEEFQKFIDQLVLGAVVTINIKDGVYAYLAILGIDLDYDNPENFKLLLSNRLRLDDSTFQFSDLFQQAISSGITTEFNSEIWKNFQDNYRNDVSDFIKNALDASSKSIVDAKNQSFTIDGNGIRGKYLNPDTLTNPSGAFDKEQIGIINNMIVFTDDNWDSAKTAIGKVWTTSGSVSTWGIVAESIYGNLFVGNRLYIQNDNNTFSVNASGATLTDASFTLTRNEGENKIILDPNVGIEISKRSTSGSYAPTFYVDKNGNIIFTGILNGAGGEFSGTIIANEGKIGMWTIDDKGLVDITNSNYIYGNGKAKIGALTIDGSEAWFHGKFYAENLDESTKFQSHQIGSLNADVINAGTLRGRDIFGCNIYWPGVKMWSPTTGFSALDSTNEIRFTAPGGGMFFNSYGANLYHDNGIHIGIANSGGTYIDGNIYTTDSTFSKGKGMSTVIPLGPAGPATLSATTFSGAGLNDASFSGTYSGAAQTVFKVVISGGGTVDSFDFYVNGFLVASAMDITGGPQYLAQGISVMFASKTGHSMGNYWMATAAIGASSQSLTFINGILVDTQYYPSSGSSTDTYTPSWHKEAILASGDSLSDILYDTSLSSAYYPGTLSGSPIEYYFETKGSNPYHANYSPSDVNGYKDVKVWGFFLWEKYAGSATGSGGGREIRYGTGGGVVYDNLWEFVSNDLVDQRERYDGYNYRCFFHKNPSIESVVCFSTIMFRNFPFGTMSSDWRTANAPLPTGAIADQYQPWEFGTAIWY